MFQIVSFSGSINLPVYNKIMNGEKLHILIVDDDPKLGNLLVRYLKEQQIQASVVHNGDELDSVLDRNPFDLIILDIMLPGEDGLSIARRLRVTSDIPIIMLSARGEDTERIIGLEVGADDYLAKPFNPRELLARIRAVLRRPVLKDNENSSGQSHVNINAHSKIFEFGPFRFNSINRTLSKNNQSIELTSGEFDILEAFIKNANKVLSRDQLIDHLKGYERSPFDRSIDVRVTRLRKKLGNNRYIHTVRGVGYMFVPDLEEDIL